MATRGVQTGLPLGYLSAQHHLGQILRVVLVAGGVGDRHRADKDLPGRKRPDQPDPHLPVKPQRTNRGLDRMAETTGEAVWSWAEAMALSPRCFGRLFVLQNIVSVVRTTADIPAPPGGIGAELDGFVPWWIQSAGLSRIPSSRRHSELRHCDSSALLQPASPATSDNTSSPKESRSNKRSSFPPSSRTRWCSSRPAGRPRWPAGLCRSAVRG